GRTTDIECAFQGDIDDSAEAIGRKLLRGTKKVPRRAINDYIDLAETFDRGSNCFFNFFGFAHVGGDSKSLPDIRAFRIGTLPNTGFIDRFRGGFEMFNAPTDKRHIRAGLSECMCDAAPDARDPASHK